MSRRRQRGEYAKTSVIEVTILYFLTHITALFLHYEFKTSITIFTYSQRVTKIYRDVGNVGSKRHPLTGRKFAPMDGLDVEAWCWLSLLLLPQSLSGLAGPIWSWDADIRNSTGTLRHLVRPCWSLYGGRTIASSPPFCLPRTAESALISGPTMTTGIVVVVIRTAILIICFDNM
jgi:hypothetical protein